MIRFLSRIVLVGALIFVAWPADSMARQQSDLPPGFDEAFPLYTAALGDFTRDISSDDPEAQAYFNQGFQMMYAFTTMDAARSFREAWKRDPTCAICHWGEAWAWGSYLNATMSPGNAPHAYAAIQEAMRLRDHASDSERAFIDAMSVRYVEDFDPELRAVQDSAYAQAMKEVSEAWPDDLDAATLYGEALFLLEPRRGTRDVDDPDVKRLHDVLEGVLARDIRHPGACHLYVHATESTQHPEMAEPCAEFLGNSIPGASHINHMPSHTWNEIGRWGDAVRANIQAWHSDQKASIGEGFAIYPSHNLHMLLFAASMDGQGALAIQAGKDYAKLTGNSMYQVLTLLRFGRFDEIPEVDDRPESGIAAGMWEFAQGYARLRLGEPDSARVLLDRLTALSEESDAMFRFHSGKDLFAIVAGILDGELKRNAGDLDGAIAAFEGAVERYDSLTYDEPEPLPFSPRHWLGSALLEAHRADDATRVYRRELDHHPHNGWSLWGLREALRVQGVSYNTVEADFNASWDRSDTWIRNSRF